MRAAYRVSLAAARTAARGRAPSETPRELAARLLTDDRSDEAVELPAEHLRALTTLYEAARYAGYEPAKRLRDAAWADAEALVGALGEPAGAPIDVYGRRVEASDLGEGG